MRRDSGTVLLSDSECGITSAKRSSHRQAVSVGRGVGSRLVLGRCYACPSHMVRQPMNFTYSCPPTRNRVQRIDIDNLKFAMLDLRPIRSQTPDVIR